MGNERFLGEDFERHRPHLRSVAYRMLGSASAADDAVQEAWLRLARAGADGVDDLRAWLTTVVARICLDHLRSRRIRRETAIDPDVEVIASDDNAEADMALADSVGVAMLVVLDRLAPAERVAFVLHDMFDLPFDDVAEIVGRSPAAARQLASRARRRVRGADAVPQAGRTRRREVVEAFLAAARGGDFAALLAVLDPDVVLRADAAAVAASVARAESGAPAIASKTTGREAVARIFHGRAQAAQFAFIDGQPGLVFAPGGRPFVVFSFRVRNGRITAIDLIADRDKVAAMALDL